MAANPSPDKIQKLDSLISKTVSGPTTDVNSLDMIANYPDLQKVQ